MNEMIEDTIGVDTVDYGGPRRSTCTPAIVACTLLKVKNIEGRYNRKTKKIKSSNRNIKTRDALTLKIATNGLEVVVNSHRSSLCAMDV